MLYPTWVMGCLCQKITEFVSSLSLPMHILLLFHFSWNREQTSLCKANLFPMVLHSAYSLPPSLWGSDHCYITGFPLTILFDICIYTCQSSLSPDENPLILISSLPVCLLKVAYTEFWLFTNHPSETLPEKQLFVAKCKEPFSVPISLFSRQHVICPIPSLSGPGFLTSRSHPVLLVSSLVSFMQLPLPIFQKLLFQGFSPRLLSQSFWSSSSHL